MLINKTDKDLQTRSDMPNYNWLGGEWYLVEDNSPLAQKIEKLYPRFDFVLDENGELIDVEEIPKTQEEINEENILEIKKELEELDKTINRATEDLYSLTNVTPYQTVQETIDRKNELRQELKILI